MSRTGVRRRRLGTVLVGAVLAASWVVPLAHALGPDAAAPVAAHRYVVRPGDTLWSIARSLSPERDPRAVVDQIAAANHVDPGILVPGQTLVIPG